MWPPAARMSVGTRARKINMKRLVIGISGSSSPYLGIRLLECLARFGEVETHLVLSDNVGKTLEVEAPGWTVEKVQALANHCHLIQDVSAPIASGSFLTDGMVVVPCSMRTLAAISIGLGDNLLTRAADVTLKERRTLIVVPRETPLNLAHLRNMVSLAEMGAVILPPIMAFYHQPRDIAEMVDHTVGKILDVLKIPHELFKRWQGAEKT